MKVSIPKNLSWSTLIQDPWPLTAVWLISGILAMTIPRRQWNEDKMGWYNYYGYQIEYEQNQRAYQQGQNQNYNQYQQYNGQQYGARDCGWFQWQCRKQNYLYQQANGDGNQVRLPMWYIFLGGESEEMRRQREEAGRDGIVSDEPTGALRFVYAWTIILFIGLMSYGIFVMSQRRSPLGLLVSLLMFAQFSLLNMLMIPQGVISTEGRDMEDSIYGWYGQMGVLLVYTNFWMMMYSVIFATAFGARMVWARFFGKHDVNEVVAEDGSVKESSYGLFNA